MRVSANILAPLLAGVVLSACESRQAVHGSGHLRTSLVLSSELRAVTKILPQLVGDSARDTAQRVYQVEPADFFSDSASVLAGRFFDNKNVFAVISKLDSTDQADVKFYRLTANQTWRLIGHSDQGGRWLECADLNGDGQQEVFMTRYPSNVPSQNVFIYLPAQDSVCYAEAFPGGEYAYNPRDHSLEVAPINSSSFAEYRFVYRWHQNRLIIWKKACLYVVDQPPHYHQELAYSANPVNDRDSLQVVFDERYDPRNRKHRHCWDELLPAVNAKLKSRR